MNNLLRFVIGFLGAVCIIGGVIMIFVSQSTERAVVVIVWGAVLLAVCKVGIPENNGLFSRKRREKNNKKED